MAGLAQAQAFPAFLGEKIDDFALTAKIDRYGKAEISEKISYNFGSRKKHGIYRSIPVRYKNSQGVKFDINFKLKDVRRFQNGQSVKEKYKIYSGAGNNTLAIKIGNPYFLVSGKQTYLIVYTVQGVINNFENYDEFYWNVTGNGWGVPIERASANLSFASATIADKNALVCFTGREGETKNDCQFSRPQPNQARFSLKKGKPLFSQEGLTIGIKLQKGGIVPMPLFQKIINFVRNNWIVFLPILLLLWLYPKFLKYGKEPKGKGTIVPEFSIPGNLTPAELGTLIDQKADGKDISATIIDLAVKGYITIQEKKSTFGRNYQFTRTQKPARDLQKFEKLILETITNPASNNLKILRRREFSKALLVATGELYRLMQDKQLFTTNIMKTRVKYIGAGIGLFLGSYLLKPLGIVYSLSLLVSGIIVLIFSYLMPKKTQKGALLYEKAMGLKLYIKTAEKHRLEFAEKENTFFEKLLPYAMVFGLTKKWAKAFEGLGLQQPSWFISDYPFQAIYFADSMNRFTQATAQSFSGAPGGGSAFGSGGFSGGGFGGGGGGSW